MSVKHIKNLSWIRYRLEKYRDQNELSSFFRIQISSDDYRSLVFLGVNILDFVKYDQNINILEYVYIDKYLMM